MVKFSREKVLLLHQLIAQETGGEVGLRDQALLEATDEDVDETCLAVASGTMGYGELLAWVHQHLI